METIERGAESVLPEAAITTHSPLLGSAGPLQISLAEDSAGYCDLYALP